MMNKQIRVLCMAVLSFLFVSNMQVQALPSFKKSVGLIVLTGGLTYAWLNRDSIQKSVQELKQELKNNPRKFMANQFEKCKKEAKNAKKLIYPKLKKAIAWAGKKLKNFSLSSLFSTSHKNTDLVDSFTELQVGGEGRQMFTGEFQLGDPHKEKDVA